MTNPTTMLALLTAVCVFWFFTTMFLLWAMYRMHNRLDAEMKDIEEDLLGILNVHSADIASLRRRVIRQESSDASKRQ